MEQPEELQHGCPACAGAPESKSEPEPEKQGGDLSRRSMLQLGVATGVGAATVRFSPAFADALRGAGPAVAPVLHAPLAGAQSPAPQPLAQQVNWPVPPIVTRAEWGANEAQRKPGQSYDSVVEKIVVHHTVTPNDPVDPYAMVRSVYEYSISGVYIDIAYHFLIDAAGRIYEGRWAQNYPPGAAHIGENSQRQSVQGAATLGHNPRTIAIAMLGTFTDILPTPAAMSSLNTMLAWKCARWGIDPLGATPYVNSDGGVEVFGDIIGHRDVVPTICPGNPILSLLPTIRSQVSTRIKDGIFGYWVAAADGTTQAFGDIPDVGDPQRLGLHSIIQAIVAHPSGLGYWALGTDGGVFTFGPAQFFGSMGGTRLNQPVIGMAATHTGRGYWLLARDGGIFSFGDARFFGSTGNIRLNQPVVAMAATPTGNGYWLLARDGGIFCFGDAQFFGSGPGRGLQVPAVAVAPTTTGRGYAILASNGAVLPFGDATSYGNASGAVVGFAGRLLPRA